MMKPAFATPSLALGTSQFVRCSALANSSKPSFAVARHRAARMTMEDSVSNGEAVSRLTSDSGEMIVDPPVSNPTSEVSEVASETVASTEIDNSSSVVESAAGEASYDASSGEEFFSTQPGLMGVIDDDDDLDVGEIITPEPPGYWRNRVAIKEAQQTFKLHETDSGSPEFQIATLTKKIEYLTTHLKSNPKDFSSTRGLLRMVSTRRKLLKYLKKCDSERFNNIVSGLKIRISQKLRNL